MRFSALALKQAVNRRVGIAFRRGLDHNQNQMMFMLSAKTRSLGLLGALTAGLVTGVSSVHAQYPPPSVSDGLQLYSPMDNATVGAGSGADSTQNGPFTVQDVAGTPENGTAGNFLSISSPTVTAHVTSGASGQVGEALQFDPASTADNRAVTYGDVEDIGTGDYSVSLWFNAATTSGTMYVAGKGNRSSAGSGWCFFIENGGLFVRAAGGSTANRASQNTHDFTTGTWYHVVMVVDNAAGTVTGYLNGSNAGWANGGGGPSGNTFPPGTDMSTTDSLALGIRGDGLVEYKGLIDDFAVWNRKLTSDEVTGIYNAGLAGNGLLAAADSDHDGMPDSWEDLVRPEQE